MSEQHDLAWAAGLFEGEGCFTMIRQNSRGRNNVHLAATLDTTDEDVARTFGEVIGFGKVSGPRFISASRKQVWRFGAYGKNAERLFELLEPWLHSRRQARWSELLAERRLFEQQLPGIRAEIARKRNRIRWGIRTSQRETLF